MGQEFLCLREHSRIIPKTDFYAINSDFLWSPLNLLIHLAQSHSIPHKQDHLKLQGGGLVVVTTQSLLIGCMVALLTQDFLPLESRPSDRAEDVDPGQL